MGSFLLTSLLLPRFAANARCVAVSSIGHYNGKLDPKDIDRSRFLAAKTSTKEGDSLDPKTVMALYADAKLAQVAYTREFQALLDSSETYASKRIIASSCHPGLVAVRSSSIHPAAHL